MHRGLGFEQSAFDISQVGEKGKMPSLQPLVVQPYRACVQYSSAICDGVVAQPGAAILHLKNRCFDAISAFVSIISQKHSGRIGAK